ncbi:hypothetical protein Tco_0788066 [Tanacetum coccineum]
MQAELVVTLCVLEKNRPEGCIAEETITEETIEFFREYRKSMETIGIPPDKDETGENEEGKPLSAGKSNKVFTELFQKAHLYVIHNTDELVPYIEQIPLLKCDWVNHRGGGVKRDTTLGYTLLDLNNLGHKFVMLLSGLCVIAACTLDLQLTYAHYICTLHLQLAFATKHLHIAFEACI